MKNTIKYWNCPNNKQAGYYFVLCAKSVNLCSSKQLVCVCPLPHECLRADVDVYSDEAHTLLHHTVQRCLQSSRLHVMLHTHTHRQGYFDLKTSLMPPSTHTRQDKSLLHVPRIKHRYTKTFFLCTHSSQVFPRLRFSWRFVGGDHSPIKVIG